MSFATFEEKLFLSGNMIPQGLYVLDCYYIEVQREGGVIYLLVIKGLAENNSHMSSNELPLSVLATL